jgi:hypothetical protein
LDDLGAVDVKAYFVLIIINYLIKLQTKIIVSRRNQSKSTRDINNLKSYKINNRK